MLLLPFSAFAAEEPVAAASRLLVAATRGDEPARWFDAQSWALAEALPRAGFVVHVAAEAGERGDPLAIFEDGRVDDAEWATLRGQGAAAATAMLGPAACTAGDKVELHPASAHPDAALAALWPERARLQRLALVELRCGKPELIVVTGDFGTTTRVTGLALTESPAGWRLAGVVTDDTAALWARFAADLEIDVVAAAAAQAAKLDASAPPAFSTWAPPRLPRRDPAPPNDLDGDGRADVVLPSQGFGVVGVVRAGTLRRVAQTFPSGGFGRVAGAADVDGDGFADLVLAAPGESDAGEPPVPGSVWIFPGGPGLDLSRHRRFSEDDPQFGDVRALGDFDGDGRGDVVVRGRRSIQVRFGGALDQVGAVMPLPERNHALLGLVAVGDVDGDGAEDLWLREHVTLGGSEGKERAFLLHGGATVRVEPVEVLAGVRELGGADLDGDGAAELLGLVGNEAVVFRQKRGKWSRSWSVPSRGCGSAAVADFDGDGSPEVALGCSGEARLYSSSGAPLHTLANPAKGFGQGVFAPGDVDGDGRIELVVQGKDGAWLYTNPLTASAPAQAWSLR